MTKEDSTANQQAGVVSQRMLRVLVAFLVLIVGLVAWSRWTDQPLVSQAPDGNILRERVLYLTGEMDGSARVTDADGAVIAVFERNEAVFVSTIARVLERERGKHQADMDAPVILRLREGDRLSVYDPQTERETELESFGRDNLATFEALLLPDNL